MKLPKFRRLYIFLKVCALIFIAFFLVYFILDFALARYLSHLEMEYNRELAAFLEKQKVSLKTADIDYTKELETIIHKAGFNLRNYGARGNNAEIDNFFQMNHRFLETALETPDDSLQAPETVLLDYLALVRVHALSIRDVLLKRDDPSWAGDGTTDIDLLKLGQIGEWLAAESVRAAADGKPEESALFAEALKRLSLSLLTNRSQDYWLTSASLAQTHSGILRKIGGICPEAAAPDISPYYEALQGTILGQTERMLRGTRNMSKLHYYKLHRREGMIWRTYGRLWFRYSLIVEIKSRLRDYKNSKDYLTCGNFRPPNAFAMKKTFWMMNGGEFRTEDLRFRLQKLALSFEFTKWVLSIRNHASENRSTGLLECPQIKTIKREEGGTIIIGYESPAENKTHIGVIDIPNKFRSQK